MDAFGMVGGWESLGERMVPDWERFRAIAALARLGFGGQIVLGADIAYKTATYLYGGAGYTHLPTNAIPTLRMAGVSETDIRQMTVDTPARVLTIG